MSFLANTASIKQYADVIKSQGEHAEKADQYAEHNLEISDMKQGLINLVEGAHNQVQAQVTATMQHLALLCDAAQTELQRTASCYQSTDEANSARLDATYPFADSGPMPPVVTKPPNVEIKEIKAPEGRLTTPGTPQGFTNPLDPINTISNGLSPGWWINEVLNETINVNPKDEAANLVAGDWEDFAKCSSAFNSLSYFCGDVHDNITANTMNLLNGWEGHAAESAQLYFKGVANSLASYRAALAKLRDTYESEAKGVWEFSEAIGDEIQDIFDNIFWAGVEVLGGWILSETEIGAATLWAGAALECKSIVDDWGTITHKINDIQKGTMGAAGVITTLVQSNGDLQKNPLPGNYSSPVGR